MSSTSPPAPQLTGNTPEAYFQYKPSLALNIIALVLFGLITIVVAIQCVKCKINFMWVVVFTGALEVSGYVCHLIALEGFNLTAYIVNLVFIIMAPNFLALVNYNCVGKIAEQLDLKGRFLNAKTLASVFFMIDILCIGVQGAGAAIISATLQNSGTASQSGTNIYLIGLAIQLFFFASFAGVTAYVYHLQRTKAANAVPIQLYICLAATIVLITLRNIYRVIEIAVGWAGYLNATEKYFYCLDALPIFLAFCVYCLLPFGKYLDAPLALRLPTSVREIAVVDNTSSNGQRPIGTTEFAASKPMVVGQNSGRGRTENVSATAIA